MKTGELKPADPTTGRTLPSGLDLLRVPFPPHHISKLPKPTKKQTEDVKADFKKGIRCQICGAWHHPDVVHLDYVGHAALTDRLLDADPQWTWEPVANPQSLGLPTADGGMWIWLTVCGVKRLGFGFADKEGGDGVKEVIGDALRNAAMRFGCALELWHKGQLHLDDEPEPKKYPSPVTSALEGETFTKEQIAKLNKLANSLVDLCTLSTEGEDVDYKIWELMEPLDSGERLYLWELLKPQSKVRTQVKAVVIAYEHKKAA